MTVQEAIKILDNISNSIKESSELGQALEIALVSLEKQIPKKPVKTLDGSLACECGLVLQVKNKRRCLYCCHNCGQAIDWEGEE